MRIFAIEVQTIRHSPKLLFHHEYRWKYHHSDQISQWIVFADVSSKPSQVGLIICTWNVPKIGAQSGHIDHTKISTNFMPFSKQSDENQ
jgi:hypothetical protein